MHTVLRAVDGLNEWTGRIIAVATVFIVLFTIYDVGSRALFSRPTDWAFEVTKQLYALHFMMLGGYALLHRSHVEVDVFKERLSARGQALLDVLGYLVFFLPFVIVLLAYSIRFASRSWASGETTYGILAIPVYPIKTVICIAAVLLALQALATFARAVTVLLRGEERAHVA
ncbi:TRAP transporter small permease subunit [Spiribacter halobius]|uniref:TRAP transporter small permease protein n=1 Tax=Sediminicurvatus halobius TaxID=2182432 RepID=A0A2U2N0K2_9GAMM|nr:TRAP transporter small permease subunit [Spiribacter halobius]PWG62573.1 C4-dicarboxylate ABC transporter permease [Spiribacter halobius]UEX78512.1 TRAP transporter small permease subunit [Spiribacter halobius]